MGCFACVRVRMSVWVAGVLDDTFPLWWAGRQAVLTLPEHITVSNAGQIREELLAVINGGAAAVIADMSATLSCDHAGANAVARAYQRAVVSRTQLKLVVTAQTVRRVLGIEGLDRQIPIYPSLEAAIAADAPAEQFRPGEGAGTRGSARQFFRTRQSRAGPGSAAITPALLWQLIDALGDGLALTDDDGRIVLANRRLADMLGYGRDELIGRPVEDLVPADLRAAHRGHRATYAREPSPRPMRDRARLVGLRKDGATVPVEISLSPVPTATGHFTLTVIRDATEIRKREDLADLAWAAVAEQADRSQELLDRVVQSLYQVGLSLQAAADLPSDVARERITDALARLDETIQDIRDHAFASGGQPPPSPAPPNGAS